MILYFADRKMQILGQASTSLPGGFVIADDLKQEDVETGVASFSCYIGFDESNRIELERMTNAGNYLLRSSEGETEFYTIIDSEIDTKNKEVYIYAEDAGLDLLNEIVGEFEAEDSYNAEWYINKYTVDSGFEIGINEIPASTVSKLKWESESTVTARLASIATQFGGFEISYTFDIKGLEITRKKINIFKKRGKDTGVTLRLNMDIDKIVTSKSVANLATAFLCTGGVPENEEKPITFSSKGYTYSDEDDDFFVDGDMLKSKKANAKWSRYIWNKEPNKLNGGGGYIVRPYSYNTTNPETLKSHAMTELKKVCDMEINYKIDIRRLPEGVKVGDRVNIVDDAGEMYVSTRILKLEFSVTGQKQEATLGEHLIKTSGISQKVLDLAAQFAITSQSAERALEVAKKSHNDALNAIEKAESAIKESEDALDIAGAAKEQADSALSNSNTALEKADGAAANVQIVQNSVAEIETIVNDAKEKADTALGYVESANTNADEARSRAESAEDEAAEAKEAAQAAQSAAESAIANAATAQSAAGEAKTLANSASETAQAAKADAEQAKKDFADFTETLETTVETIEADFARKSDLTTAEATLQAQITQNADQLSITHNKVLTVDETANDAKTLAEAAQSAAGVAQSQADKASADALSAQTAANTANAAAIAAQNDATAAKTAAENAQNALDTANAELAEAKANLATVSGRVDATEEEIAAAQNAVNEAQAAANQAKADAEEANEKALAAQSTADTAKTNAEAAQAKANEAASKADIAQKTADEAKGNATAAQEVANQAKANAQTAQEKANEANDLATAAQNTANEAVANAATAQAKAEEAENKALLAQSDLDTAKANLEDVQSRVGATEEEIAAAQEAVNAAQSKADEAKADAERAQAAADKAKADAATAQSAADEAKTAADNAQDAADEAKAAADKAQADVNALAVRVTDAETEIVKTNERIDLTATKTELSATLGGYYTKEETDSKISVKADSITQSVSSTYATKQAVDNIAIGGRNLLTRCTATLDKYAKGVVYNDKLYEIILDAYGALLTDYIAITPGKQYAFSRKAGEGDYFRIAWFDSEQQILGDFVIEEIPEGEAGSYIWTAPAGAEWLRVSFPESPLSEAKCEEGNKVTDYTPSPIDVANDIETVQKEAESAIHQLADQISKLVRKGDSGSLLMQDANGLYYFDVSGLAEEISAAKAEGEELAGVVYDEKGNIDLLRTTADALIGKTEYIRQYTYTDENGNEIPCLELGDESEFRVRITNQEIDFVTAETVPAKIDRKMLIIEKTIIKDLQFGDEEDKIPGVWIWQARANGNLGLSWKGGTN